MGYLDNKTQQEMNAQKAAKLDSLVAEREKQSIYNQGRVDTEAGMAAMLNQLAAEERANYYDVPSLQPGQYPQPPMNAMDRAIMSDEAVLPSPQTMPGLAGSIAGIRG